MKPLAIQFRANKNSRSKPAAKSSEPRKAKPKPAIPGPSSGEELKATYQARRAELLKQQAALLTDEQRASSEAARKQAIADGKKGMALRRAIDAGANLTAEQKKQLEELRREMGQLTRRNRERQ